MAKCELIESTDHEIKDTVALKRYNGASHGHYCSWGINIKIRKFNKENNIGLNYVETCVAGQVNSIR